MTELTLSTPSILFSAISLILLAYTNRFLSYAQLVRTLKADYDKNPSTITHLQLANLRRRLYMARSMQLFGVSSLLLCVVCTFLIYIGLQMVAVYTFGVALVLLTISLGISIRELLISVRALELHLDSFERMKTLTATSGREGNIETPRRRKGTSEEHRPASVPTDQSLRTKKPAKGKTKKEESNKRIEAKAASYTSSSSAAATTAVAATSRTTAATTTGSTTPAAPKGSGAIESSGTSGTSAASKSRRKKAATTAVTAASSTSATEEGLTSSPTKRQSKGSSDKQASTSSQKQAPKSKAVVGETDDAVRVTATRSKTTLPIASTEAPEGKESSDTAIRTADKSDGTSSSQRTQQGRRRGGRSRTRSTSETATAPGTGNAIQESSLPAAENINAEDIKG